MKIGPHLLVRIFADATRAIRPMQQPLAALVDDEPHLRADAMRITKRGVEFSYMGETIGTIDFDPQIKVDLQRGDTVDIKDFNVLIKVRIA